MYTYTEHAGNVVAQAKGLGGARRSSQQILDSPPSIFDFPYGSSAWMRSGKDTSIALFSKSPASSP